MHSELDSVGVKNAKNGIIDKLGLLKKPPKKEQKVTKKTEFMTKKIPYCEKILNFDIPKGLPH